MKPEVQYLQQNFAQADEAAHHLINSVERCKDFISGKDYSEDQLVELEALTSRFARMSDLLPKKY